MTTIDIETAGRIIGAMHDPVFSCPCCGRTFDAGETDVSEHVVSFWGEDDHDFTCDECGADFVVREIVMRSYATAKTADELE